MHICIIESQFKSTMITFSESWGYLGKIEAKISMGSDRVLSVDQQWDFEKMRYAQIQGNQLYMTWKLQNAYLYHWKSI